MDAACFGPLLTGYGRHYAWPAIAVHNQEAGVALKRQKRPGLNQRESEDYDQMVGLQDDKVLYRGINKLDRRDVDATRVVIDFSLPVGGGRTGPAGCAEGPCCGGF